MKVTQDNRVSEPTQAKRVSAPQATQAPSAPSATLTLREASNLLRLIKSATDSYKLISDNHCYFLKGITMIVTVRDISNYKYYTLAIPLTEWFTTTGQRELEQIECISHHWVLASAPSQTKPAQLPTSTQSAKPTQSATCKETVPHHLSLGYLIQRLLTAPYNSLTYRLKPNTSYSLTSLPTAIIDSKFSRHRHSKLGIRDSKLSNSNRANIKCRIKWVSEPHLKMTSEPQPYRGKWVIKTGQELKYVEKGISDSDYLSYLERPERIRVQKVANPLTVSFKLIGYQHPQQHQHQELPQLPQQQELPELYLADL